MTEQINLEQIRRDGGTQSRAGMNGPVVYEYAELMREGATFPEITVFFDGKDYWLADGYHRHAAAVEAGLRSISADVRQGTQRDAVLFSVGANSTHGLRRTNEDKRRAVETLLQDDEWNKWSDREIARRCGVDHKTVARLRSDVSGENPQMERVVNRGGTTFTQTMRHWGLSNGMAFWSKVDALGLDRATIIGRLQKGANLLTDLTITRDEAFHRMNSLALEAVTAAFPVGCIVKHTTGKYGKVNHHDPLGPVVDDLKTDMQAIWRHADCALSTEEEWKASVGPVDGAPAADETPDIELPIRQVEFLQALAKGDAPVANGATRMALRGHGLISEHDEWAGIKLTAAGRAWLVRHDLLPESVAANHSGPEDFAPGDIVKTPVGHAGEVCKVSGRLVDVRTINGTKTYNKAFLTLVRRLGDPVEAPTAESQPEVIEQTIGTLPWELVRSADGGTLHDANRRHFATLRYDGLKVAHLIDMIPEAVNNYHRYQSERVQKIIAVLRRILDFEEGLTDASPGLKNEVFQAMRWLSDLDEVIDEELKIREQVS